MKLMTAKTDVSIYVPGSEASRTIARGESVDFDATIEGLAGALGDHVRHDCFVESEPEQDRVRGPRSKRTSEPPAQG